MRKVGQACIIVCFAFFMGSCEKDIELPEFAEKSSNEEVQLSVFSNADDSEIDESTKANYLYMASHFAPRNDNNIELPQEIIDKYYDAFISLYNAQELYCRDSILDVYKSHFHWTADTYDFISYIYLEVDSNETWYQKWIEGNIMTGNNGIDVIMTTYNFETVSYYNNAPYFYYLYTDADTSYWLNDYGQQYFRLSSNNYVNMENLAKLFSNIKGITYADPISKYKWVALPSKHWEDADVELIDDTDKITLTFTPSYSYIGDGRKWWKFDVYPDGKVAFVEKN